MARRRKQKSTKQFANSRDALQSANTNQQRAVIPRNPRYNSMDIRDTPLSARGIKLVYDALGESDAGRLWALLALHPCGEYISSCDGIPDESMAAAVTPTYRAHTTISWNPKLFTAEVKPDTNFVYDIQIVTPPFPELDYIYRIRYQGTWSRWVAIKLPSFSHKPDGGGAGLGLLGMSKYRYMARGVTLYLDAPRLSDNGRFIGGQIAPSVSSELFEWSQESVLPTGGGTAQFGEGYTNVYGIRVPDDEDQLVLQDSLVAQWPARDGGYIPHRFVSPVQQYIQTEEGDTTASAPVYKTDGTASTVDVPASFLTIVKEDGYGTTIDNAMEFYHATDPTWAAPSGRSGLAPTRGVWAVSPPGNLYTGVAFFKAISGTASIQVKTRVYLEAEAAEKGSPAAPFAHKPPCLDRKALDLVTRVAQVQPHVFYARDNDFSSILQSIGKILPGILNWIEPVADRVYKSGLPFLAPIGQGVGAFTRGVKASMDHFMQ